LLGLPTVDHAVAVSQPPEAGHLVARRSAVKVHDDVIVGDQQLQATDDVAMATQGGEWLRYSIIDAEYA